MGIQHTPGLRNKYININNWSNKNYDDLKNTLTNFIPLIRFLNISSDDFYDKVRSKLFQVRFMKMKIIFYIVNLYIL